jgi:hypothetical protein
MDAPGSWQRFRRHRRLTLICLAVWLPITVVAVHLSVLAIATESGGEVVGFNAERSNKLMTKSAALERACVVAVVGYLAFGAYNEVRLEWADASVQTASAKPVIYDGIEFATMAEVAVFQFEAVRDEFFPWAGHIGMPLCYLILSGAAACYGGIVREFYDAMTGNGEPKRRYLFGFVLGPLVFGASVFGPFLLVESDTFPTPRLTTLLAASVLCGCFVEKTWQFLESLLEKVFKRIKE